MDSLVSRSATPSELVLEAVPPELKQGEKGIEAVLEKIEELHRDVGFDAVNIPEVQEESSKSSKGERRKPFEPRVEPRALARRIQQALGLPCIINRVVVHLERERQLDWFRETRDDYGVNRVVMVGGERSDQRYPGPSVPEATRLLKKQPDTTDIQVGNICIPSRPGEGERMKRKIDSGADFFTTQVIFHADEVTTLLDELGDHTGPGNAPNLMVSLAPVRSERNIRFLHWLGVNLSSELEEWLTVDPDSVIERSLSHIQGMWGHIAEDAFKTESPFPISANIAPIGRIPPSTTVSLARTLQNHRIHVPRALGTVLT